MSHCCTLGQLTYVVMFFAVEYYDDKKDPENYVYIGVDVKGLKTTLLGSKANNADVTLDRTDRYVNTCYIGLRK